MSVSDLLWLLMGIGIGVWLVSEFKEHKSRKTLAELDQDVLSDLERYKNLSQSLLADVKYWRDRFHTLQKAKEKQNDR